MSDFWALARMLTQRRGLFAAAVFFAVLSAIGLGAGILGVAPVLDAVLGQGQDLPTLARKAALKLPEWLRPGESLYTSLPTDRFTGVLLIVIGLGVLTLLGSVANFLHQYLALTIVAEAIGRLRARAFAHVVHLPLRTLLAGSIDAAAAPGIVGAVPVATRGPGVGADAVSRIITDAFTLGQGFSALLSKALAQVFKGAAALAAAIVLNWKVAIVALLVAPILATIIRKLGTRIRRATRAALAGQAGLYQTATEVIGGLRVVKVHTSEQIEAARFESKSNDVVRQEMKVRSSRALSAPLVETVAIFVLGGLVMVATKAILDGQLRPRDFILVLGALGVAGGSLKPLTTFWTDLQQASAAAQRYRRLLSLPIEEPVATGASPKPSLPRHAKSLTFERVTFTYPASAIPAVREVSLSVPHGATVAFVGPNGSGKTSLLALVPRLFEPDSGRILVDGTDLASINLRSLRDQIGVVTQDTILFRGSIRENIAYGITNATDAAIRAAARKAHAEEFILAKPGQYDHELGDGGAGLSGGQRQRIAIARAILRDPAILILDEATSMIDAESEHHINAAIDEFVTHKDTPAGSSGSRTCLIVAHRLSTVRNADLIVVMDAGQVRDSGTHDELLARCDLYRTLVQRQLGGGMSPEVLKS